MKTSQLALSIFLGLIALTAPFARAESDPATDSTNIYIVTGAKSYVIAAKGAAFFAGIDRGPLECTYGFEASELTIRLQPENYSRADYSVEIGVQDFAKAQITSGGTLQKVASLRDVALAFAAEGPVWKVRIFSEELITTDGEAKEAQDAVPVTYAPTRVGFNKPAPVVRGKVVCSFQESPN